MMESPYHLYPLDFRSRSQVEVLTIGMEGYPTIFGPTHVLLLYFLQGYGSRFLEELRNILYFYGVEYLQYIHVLESLSSHDPSGLDAMDRSMLQLLQVNAVELISFPNNVFQLYGSHQTLQNLTLASLPREQITIAYQLTFSTETHHFLPSQCTYPLLTNYQSTAPSWIAHNMVIKGHTTVVPQVPHAYSRLTLETTVALLNVYSIRRLPPSASDQTPSCPTLTLQKQYLSPPVALETVCHDLRDLVVSKERILLFCTPCREYPPEIMDTSYQSPPTPSVMTMMQRLSLDPRRRRKILS